MADETPYEQKMAEVILELEDLLIECEGKPVAFTFGMVMPDMSSRTLIIRRDIPGSNIALVGLGALILKQVTDAAKIEPVESKDTSHG